MISYMYQLKKISHLFLDHGKYFSTLWLSIGGAGDQGAGQEAHMWTSPSRSTERCDNCGLHLEGVFSRQVRRVLGSIAFCESVHFTVSARMQHKTQNACSFKSFGLRL